MYFNKLIKSWSEASKDLNIKIKTPFIIKDNNRKIIFELLVENFGCKKGTIIITINELEKINIPEKYGFYCSALNPINYSVYNRQYFIDTLNDWGYYGEKAETPIWYTGEFWSK